MGNWNDTSASRLEGIDPRLVEILEMARTNSGVPFEISEGKRSQNRQQELYDSGASQTLNSRHLGGNAVDINIPDGSGGVNWDFEAYRPISDSAKAAAAELGYDDFTWGGDWDSLKDGVHFQIGGANNAAAGREIGGSAANQSMARIANDSPEAMGLDPVKAKSDESDDPDYAGLISAGQQAMETGDLSGLGAAFASAQRPDGAGLFDGARENWAKNKDKIGGLRRRFG